MIAASAELESDPTALSWSPDGRFIAVGDRAGICTIVNGEDFSLAILGTKKTFLAGKNKDTWVEDVKFSPDSR